jgi:hypothetical protein
MKCAIYGIVMNNLPTKKNTHGGRRVKGQFGNSQNFGMYTVLDVNRMMRLPDARVRRRLHQAKKDLAIILIDHTCKLDNINFECTIVIRRKCYELLIHDEKIASNVKKLAKQLDAIAYI